MLISLIRKLNPKPYTLNPKNGFTLIEVLVATSLFTIVMGIVVGVFIKSLQTQKQITSLISANSNASLAIEELSREIRTGKGFCQDETACLPMPDGSFQKLIFTSAGQTIIYSRAENNDVGALFKQSGNEPGASLTNEDVNVRRLAFYLQGNRLGTPETPRITIVLQIGTTEKPFQEDIINLQTTISTRVSK